MKTEKLKKYLAVVVSVSLVVITVAATLPSMPTSAVTGGSSALSIVPRQNLVINPGQTETGKLTITNLSPTQNLNLSIRVIDFTYLDQSGSPKFFLDTSRPPTPWSLKPFLTVPKSEVLPAGKSKTIDYTVSIPKGQGAGSYYSAILYSSGSNTGANVNLSASVATLLFASVPGHVHENLQLKKLGAFQSKTGGTTGNYSYLNLNEPQMLAFTLKNNGDVAEAPAGSITLRNMWGEQVGQQITANPDSSLAIIGQTRRFTTCIKPEPKQVQPTENQTNGFKNCDDPHLSPGRYTANLDLFYGMNGNNTQEIRKTVAFWYIPIWLIVAIIIAILILIWIGFKIKRKIQAFTERRQKRRFRR